MLGGGFHAAATGGVPVLPPQAADTGSGDAGAANPIVARTSGCGEQDQYRATSKNHAFALTGNHAE